MQFSRAVIFVLMIALVLPGCSSRPRDFVAVLEMPAANQRLFQAHYRICRDRVAQDPELASNDRLLSAGTGAAAGAGAGVVGAYAGAGTAMAAIGATIAAVPVVGVGAAWGIAKAQKTRKERAIKAATGLCLAQRGYVVAEWQVETHSPQAAPVISADRRPSAGKRSIATWRVQARKAARGA